jgi:hypothetical protein
MKHAAVTVTVRVGKMNELIRKCTKSGPEPSIRNLTPTAWILISIHSFALVISEPLYYTRHNKISDILQQRN